MNKISAVIITYNEGANIERCILSLKSVVDEVIVSDSNSTDNTVAIAKSLGATVIVAPFIGYGATKNRANKAALYDWVLSIDADEALDEQLVSELAKTKQDLNEKSVYIFQRLNNYCGHWINHGGWYPDKKTRLFNKKFVQWNHAEVHEQLDIPSDFIQKTLTGKLLHYSYSTIESHKNKIENYSTRGAEQAFKNGKRASWVKIYASPAFRFFRDYFIKLGFLDGKSGLIIATLTAKEVHLKYKKLLNLHSA